MRAGRAARPGERAGSASPALQAVAVRLDVREGRGLHARASSVDPPRHGSGAGPASPDVTLWRVAARSEKRDCASGTSKNRPGRGSWAGPAHLEWLALPESRGIGLMPASPCSPRHFLSSLVLQCLGFPSHTLANCPGSSGKGSHPKGEPLDSAGPRPGAAKSALSACATLGKQPPAEPGP